MKKNLILIGICAAFILMPVTTAFPIEKLIKPTIQIPNLQIPLLEDYDGTFIGGFGLVYKDENGSWAFNYYGYLAGVYYGGRYKRILGNIYNLSQEQIGYIGFISARYYLFGKIKNMQNQSLPIVGFIFYNEEYFIGRIMSIIGPPVHIWGQYTPN